MRSAAVALVAAATFFVGILMGAGGQAQDSPLPAPVVLRSPGGSPSPTAAPQDRPTGSVSVEEVEHQVEEGEVGDYDSSGPGSAEDQRESPEREEPDDNSGPGSSSSGSGSSGSGSSGSGSDNSGPGS
jgi:hypothetical protein